MITRLAYPVLCDICGVYYSLCAKIDVGCGLGRVATEIAKRYNTKVHGIDITHLIIQRAQKGYARDGVTFEQGDVTTMAFPPNTFALVKSQARVIVRTFSLTCRCVKIHSRDALLHIHEKPPLLKKFFDWLQPGGMVIRFR